MKLLILLPFVFLLSCASSLSDINRRPFADEMKLIVFKKQKLSGAKSIGKQHYEHCKSKWLMGFSISEDPTYQELMEEVIIPEDVKYMTNVKSIEYGTSGFFLGKSCVGLEGEAFQ